MHILCVGLLLLIVALLGCSVCFCKHKSHLALPFGFITCIVGITLITLGIFAISLGLVLTLNDFRDPVCAKAEQIKIAYTNAVDKIMCSNVCPCNVGKDA